jgi:hypothetical protein
MKVVKKHASLSASTEMEKKAEREKEERKRKERIAKEKRVLKYALYVHRFTLKIY